MIIGQIHLPHEFAQSGCIPSKIICERFENNSSQLSQQIIWALEILMTVMPLSVPAGEISCSYHFIAG